MRISAGVLVLLCLCATAADAQQRGRVKRAAAADRVPNEYIVVLEDSVVPEHVPELARQLAAAHGGRVEKTWTNALKGFFARMPDARAEALSRHPLVKYVEENARWHYSGVQATNIDPSTCDPTTGTCPAVADDRLWHLDRMDQNVAAPTNTAAYCTTGSQKTVYVVDSGVNKYHQEFAPSGTRIQPGMNASGDQMPADDPCLGFAVPAAGTHSNIESGLYHKEVYLGGHGTAVASLVGGNRVGVAKNVTIVPIKVSRCAEFAARARESSAAYQLNETIFVSQTGFTPGTYYRVTIAGTTAATPPASWPVIPGQRISDGGVEWEVFEALPEQTTQMLADGLDWILSAGNSGPKTKAVVTMSTYALPTDADFGAVEDAVESLLAAGLTVIASANNQNGNACDTTPARMSLANDVITVGGSMILNQPWTANLSQGPANSGVPADGLKTDNTTYGTQPAHVSTQGVRDGRWICGPGDSGVCANTTATATMNPASSGYDLYNAGSNAGPCVTLFAPAKNIFVASVTSASGYRDARVRGGVASGTSWSAPIVAGFAARLLEGNANLLPAGMRTALLANSLQDRLDPVTLNTYDHNGAEITGTPNKLLHLADVKITDQPDSATAAGSSPTLLSVTAAGTATLTYQWYQVNAGFDSATYPRGAAVPQSATAIPGASSSTYNAPAPSTPQAYFVRVSNGCGSADSDIAVVTPAANPPANLVASPGATAGTVSLVWTAVSGADSYVIERKAGTGAWTTLPGTVTSASYTDATAPASSAVLYRVRTRVGGVDSQPGNVDFTHTWTFEALTPSPFVKAVHVTQLRTILNQLTDAGGFPRQYTDAEALPSALAGQLFNHTDMTTLMTKVNIVRGQFQRGSGGFSDTPVSNGYVKRPHIQDLRTGLE